MAPCTRSTRYDVQRVETQIPLNNLSKSVLVQNSVKISTPRSLVLRNRIVNFSTSRVKVIKQEKTCSIQKTPPALSDDDDIQCVFEIDTLVFAKCKGYAAWPGQVIAIKNTPSIIKLKPKKKGSQKQQKISKKKLMKKYVYRVRFFGTDDELNITGNMMYFFNQSTIDSFSKNKFRTVKLRELFLAGLEQARTLLSRT